MSVYLRFRRETDSIALNGVARNGHGVEALTGVTGLGLPPVSTQWLTGAGDGALYRGRRVQPRDIDIKLYFFLPDREALEAELARMAAMLDGPCALDVVSDGGQYWTTEVVRVGGGDFVYGKDTIGENELTTVVTLRAGDPYFTSSITETQAVSNAGVGRGLLGNLSKLQVSASQAIGSMLIDNRGDAVAWPVWRVTGPGRDLTVTLPNGQGFVWEGELEDGEVLVIDSKAASVKLSTGENRYGDLGPAPKFLPLPRGSTLVTVSMDDTTSASAVQCTWRTRKWWVI
ncbi:phage distal tail protein [Plantactinospora sp. WMMB782]|uniref:phage distal tail protein n=1 Tax=Plantactinospora sp. WMMB782 TaxID=3404121 RepID=UPI003B95848D